MARQSRIDDMPKHYIRYEEGAVLYSMCQKTFEKLAKEADAIREYGRVVFMDFIIVSSLVNVNYFASKSKHFFAFWTRNNPSHLSSLYWNIIRIHSNITLDEIHGIIYSQNELNNGYLTTIQLEIILGYLIYRKTFTLNKHKKIQSIVLYLKILHNKTPKSLI